MSLKAFHIVFITLSALMAVWVGVWSILTADGSAAYTVLGFGSLLAAGGLVIYGVRFLEKLRDVGYM